VSISKFLIVSLICVFSATSCQQNGQPTIQAEVAAAAAATIAALPTGTPNPTFTPQPTLTLQPTEPPASTPTLLPTLTARPTYTPNPTYTAVATEVAAATVTHASPGPVVAHANAATAASPNNASALNAALIQITYAQMVQVFENVSGYVTTYKDDDPYDLQYGDTGKDTVPVNCSAAIDEFQQLLQLEVTNIDSQNPNEQAAFSFYRQAWERYMGIAVPVIDRCRTAVANNETLTTLGPTLYGQGMAILINDVNALITQAIHALEENQ